MVGTPGLEPSFVTLRVNISGMLELEAEPGLKHGHSDMDAGILSSIEIPALTQPSLQKKWLKNLEISSKFIIFVFQSLSSIEWKDKETEKILANCTSDKRNNIQEQVFGTAAKTSFRHLYGLSEWPALSPGSAPSFPLWLTCTLEGSRWWFKKLGLGCCEGDLLWVSSSWFQYAQTWLEGFWGMNQQMENQSTSLL